MGFDASGTFTRIRGADSWKDDASDGTKIKADLHDINDQDLANGLSDCITKTGLSLPTTNIPWNNKKITNLANPTVAGDAANKSYVDNLPGWPVSKNIAGANADGKLNFTASSGVNGITWSAIPMSLVSKPAVTGRSPAALSFNSTVAGTGTHLVTIDTTGRVRLNSGEINYNLVYETGDYHTPTAGYGSQYRMSAQALTISGNNTASTDADDNVSLQTQFSLSWSAGSSYFSMYKDASGKDTHIRSFCGTEPRWIMHLGDTAAEGSGATYTGSNFSLLAYDNNGATPRAYMHIDRGTQLATFYGDLTSNGVITTDSIIQSSDTTMIVASKSGGTIYFRPNGSGSSTEQAWLDTSGNFNVTTTSGINAGMGIKERAGTTGGYGDQWINWNWNGSTLTAYANTSVLGQVAWQSDYRTKRDIQPLPSMWDKVKSLNPVSYRQKEYQIYVDDPTERWGFLAHELQEKLTDYAATGVKDGADIQQPNLWVVIAALTRALQEAMARIEVLEGAKT